MLDKILNIKLMILIAGLGNPGFKYKKTRHNIGFMALDAFQKENNFPRFKLNKKAQAEITKGLMSGQEVFLVKPQTFMNNSGQAVKFLVKENSFNENSLIIVHDDFDLPLGEVKISQNSGSGGHHGVQSVIDHLKTQNFTRLRIGTRPIIEGLSDEADSGKLKAENFVLKKFSKDEEKQLPEILKKACDALSATMRT
ncbi:MAG: aminoacyl-tRNA hydrolase [Candidatus Pacebacteria bacterium]|nr:aminoacyl-tRNA hydrolase [Candidatus Paceibacterota bacterium]